MKVQREQTLVKSRTTNSQPTRNRCAKYPAYPSSTIYSFCCRRSVAWIYIQSGKKNERMSYLFRSNAASLLELAVFQHRSEIFSDRGESRVDIVIHVLGRHVSMVNDRVRKHVSGIAVEWYVTPRDRRSVTRVTVLLKHSRNCSNLVGDRFFLAFNHFLVFNSFL